MIAKQNIRLHITLSKKIVDLLDKRRKAYYDLTRSEYIKNLIMKEGEK